MSKILDLEINFPEIEGVSKRQIWYAENLREEYVIANEQRFREIEQHMNFELDHRIFDTSGGYGRDCDYVVWEPNLDKYEVIVLCSASAAGIILNLKEWLEETEGFYR